MKAYYAHAIPDYGTEFEAEVLNMMAGMGMEPLNPGNPKHQQTCLRNCMSYWIGLVRQCDALVYTRYRGKVTAGVGKEVDAALDAGLPVYLILPVGSGRNDWHVIRTETYPERLTVEETRMLIRAERRDHN
jgi:hypothetical protein